MMNVAIVWGSKDDQGDCGRMGIWSDDRVIVSTPGRWFVNVAPKVRLEVKGRS